MPALCTPNSCCPTTGLHATFMLQPCPLPQSDNPQNPHGLGHAWELLARLLNALPANRVTATAVDAVLKVGKWAARPWLLAAVAPAHCYNVAPCGSWLLPMANF